MISSNVIIITNDELDKIKNEWFQKGVERGKFEAQVISSAENTSDKVCITQGMTVRILPSYKFKEFHYLRGVVTQHYNNVKKWAIIISDLNHRHKGKLCWVSESDLEICRE